MIQVTKPYFPDIDHYILRLRQIYNNGWLTNHGPMVNELERRLKDYLGVENIILVSNGTAALQIAYKVLGLTGEVITTPFTFVATSSSLVWEGLKPVFVDIDKKTFCIDPNKIENAITNKTTAILPVHIYGNTCDVDTIQRIADKHRLKVVYDAAHSFGIKHKKTGESVLKHGDISILSFHATKIFHTCEGGALILKDRELYEKARHMIDFGFHSEYEIDSIGINAKMNELEAAMGLCVLEDMDTIIKNRAYIYAYYLKNLPDENLIFQKLNENFTQNYGYCPIVFNTENERELTCKKLNENQIFPRKYFYPPLDALSYLKSAHPMANAQNISNRILCLPTYFGLDEQQLKKIIDIIKKTLP